MASLTSKLTTAFAYRPVSVSQSPQPTQFKSIQSKFSTLEMLPPTTGDAARQVICIRNLRLERRRRNPQKMDADSLHLMASCLQVKRALSPVFKQRNKRLITSCDTCVLTRRRRESGHGSTGRHGNRRSTDEAQAEGHSLRHRTHAIGWPSTNRESPGAGFSNSTCLVYVTGTRWLSLLLNPVSFPDY